MHIYFDSYQEGEWFRGLHRDLATVSLDPFPTSASSGLVKLSRVLAYDRPDIVLTDSDRQPILVVERTVEVPSGHNVGQRFARLVQASRCGVPSIYFGPYAAMKHGGETRGPRFMNLRLFHAIEEVNRIESAPITTIRWPVDANFEIVGGDIKDLRIRAYLEFFLALRSSSETAYELGHEIVHSQFEHEQEYERQRFIEEEVRDARQYDSPPPSVRIGHQSRHPELVGEGLETDLEVVLYEIGMKAIRSDPYTGTGILYSYLYCGGMVSRSRLLVLSFPNISKQEWRLAATGRSRKDIRLFREMADAIVFDDGMLLQEEL